MLKRRILWCLWFLLFNPLIRLILPLIMSWSETVISLENFYAECWERLWRILSLDLWFWCLCDLSPARLSALAAWQSSHYEVKLQVRVHSLSTFLRDRQHNYLGKPVPTKINSDGTKFIYIFYMHLTQRNITCLYTILWVLKTFKNCFS